MRGFTYIFIVITLIIPSCLNEQSRRKDLGKTRKDFAAILEKTISSSHPVWKGYNFK